MSELLTDSFPQRAVRISVCAATTLSSTSVCIPGAKAVSPEPRMPVKSTVLVLRCWSGATQRDISAALTHSQDPFIWLRPLSALYQERIHRLIVGAPRPSALSEYVPLLCGPHQGLGVGSTHDYAKLICQGLIASVVFIEHGIPHCRPEVVGPISEQ